MKGNLRAVAAGAPLALFLALAPGSRAARAGEAVLARVGASVVTRVQLEAFEAAMRRGKTEPPPRDRLLAHLVERRLMVLAARERYPAEEATITASLRPAEEALLREVFLREGLAEALRPPGEEEVAATYVERRLYTLGIYNFRRLELAEAFRAEAPEGRKPDVTWTDVVLEDRRVDPRIAPALPGAAEGAWFGPYPQSKSFQVTRLLASRPPTKEERELELERLRAELARRRLSEGSAALLAGLRRRFDYRQDDALLERVFRDPDRAEGAQEPTVVLAATGTRVFSVADYRKALEAAARRSHPAFTSEKLRQVFNGMVDDALILEAARADRLHERPEVRERLELEADRLWSELLARKVRAEYPADKVFERVSAILEEARGRHPVTLVPAAP